MEHEDLVVSALWLCNQEARRWRHTPIEQEELVGEAAVALVRAAHRFDRSRGVPFPAFARPAIQGALRDVVRNVARRESLGDDTFAQVTSLDQQKQGNDNDLVWDVPDPQTTDDIVEALEVLRLLGTIPARERYVLIRTVIDGAEASVVAGEMGITADRVYVLAGNGSKRLQLRYERWAA